MHDTLLCLADAEGRVACFLKAGEAGLEFVSGTEGASEKVALALQELSRQGVHVRDEHFSPGQIDVDYVKVGPDDPRYLAGCVAEFRVRGWKAAVYPRAEAEIWRRLFELPVPSDLRLVFAERLGALPPEALAELREKLDRAAEDFSKINNAS